MVEAWQTHYVTAVSTLRELPAVDALVSSVSNQGLPRQLLIDLARSALEVARNEIREGGSADPYALATDLISSAASRRHRRLINATGVLLHTNVGRAPLSKAASEAMVAVAGYSNLEIDLESGNRGRRGSYSVDLLKTLTGAEDALVVNNNASAVLLTLTAIAAPGAVPVSRGELVEIGGSYRLPDVMAASGVRLIEVGATNRTRADDYRVALQLHNCRAVLKVHPSNYTIEGFAEETSLIDLKTVSVEAALPLVYDIGSGHLDADGAWLTPEDRKWLSAEPAVAQALVAGADLVTFSGDKLLGGPQAGIVVGSADLIGRLRSHPLFRAFRLGAYLDAGLAATLESYARGSVDDVPFWTMARRTYADLSIRAKRLATAIGGRVESGDSLIGAGSVPGATLASPQVTLDAPEGIQEKLLGAHTPVLARRREGALLFDLRTVDPSDDDGLASAVTQCL